MPPRIVVRTRVDGDWVFLSVEDNGSGIADDIRDRLFEPFFTSKRGDRGTGLGLAICAEIVAEMGGEIRVDTEIGRGSCFTVVLPAADPALTAEVTPPRAVEVTRQGRILIIDDDPHVRRALERLIASEHDVVVAGSGVDALERLERDTEFDVILCDLMMPDVDGVDVYEALVVHHPELCDRVIFLSGGAFTRRGQDFLESTGCPVIHKPVSLEDLLAAIGDAMRGSLH